MTIPHQTNSRWPLGPDEQDLKEQQYLYDRMLPIFESILRQERIPVDETFINVLKNIYIPFTRYLAKQQKDKPLIIGINGSQGSGKSTLTKILNAILQQGLNKRVVSLSIDDLYKSKNERLELAANIHPLFSSRGVPGTHEPELGISILNHLLEKNPTEILIPVFDKSTDDRSPESDWVKTNGVYDIVIFEGWCVGSTAQSAQALQSPVNQLEELEDSNGIWRKHVNQYLGGIYADLFSFIDIQVMLKIPDFEKVYEWRKLQEQKLKESVTEKHNLNSSIMNDSEIKRFIMHYERITRHTLDEMPDRADIVLELGSDHQIKKIIVRDNK